MAQSKIKLVMDLAVESACENAARSVGTHQSFALAFDHVTVPIQKSCSVNERQDKAAATQTKKNRKMHEPEHDRQRPEKQSHEKANHGVADEFPLDSVATAR